MTARMRKGVPMPTGGAGAPQKYPFDQMKVGECFEWACAPGEKVPVRRASISTAARLRGYSVVTRTHGRVVMCWLKAKVLAEKTRGN